jgi:hypothetical protein
MSLGGEAVSCLQAKPPIDALTSKTMYQFARPFVVIADSFPRLVVRWVKKSGQD